MTKEKWTDLVEGDVFSWTEYDIPEYDPEEKLTLFGTVKSISNVALSVIVIKGFSQEKWDNYDLGDEVKIHFKGQRVDSNQQFVKFLWHDDPLEKVKKLQEIYPELFL